MSSSRPSAMKKHDAPPSITPQRKHRNSSRTAVAQKYGPKASRRSLSRSVFYYPSIAPVLNFHPGLREYWESPYAAYSQSRGRSRWRNQFLVDYLHKQGIDRSKKQSQATSKCCAICGRASKFHLVAGGDELYPENDSPNAAPVKLEAYDGSTLIPFDWDDNEPPSSNSVSPNFSPADSQSEFPPTPEHRPNLYPSDFASLNPNINSPSISPHGDYIQQLPPFHDATPFGLPYSQAGKYSSQSPLSANIPRRRLRCPKSEQQSLSTRLWCAAATARSEPPYERDADALPADGMTPFSVKVDALSHPVQQVQPPFTLRIRLCMPTVHDMRAPPTLNGFMSGVSLENVWSVTARCVTKVYGNNACIAEDAGFLNVTNINVGTVNAALPDSSLNRCRWLDPNLSVILTQEIMWTMKHYFLSCTNLTGRTGVPCHPRHFWVTKNIERLRKAPPA
ncbi:hypothetical protein BJ912DRAFT_926441 [Pholiota molesta]|nr:hypothetical protein BJ912DRAFT_926441 [Pholiota molesta]